MLQLESPPSVITLQHESAHRQQTARGLRVLWLAGVDYELGINHGGNLRLFNYARHLIKQGHEVHLVVNRRRDDDARRKGEFLEDLKHRRIISNYTEVEYTIPRRRSRLSSLALHPTLSGFLLRERQAPIKDLLNRLVENEKTDLCIFGERDLLFALPDIAARMTTLVDWTDSFVLYRVREIRASAKNLKPKELLASVRYLLEAFVQEKHYGRHGSVNLTVSPVDCSFLSSVNRRPQSNRVLLNGVELEDLPAVKKTDDRVIFTGNMNFPPNYQAALWFIENVLPPVAKHRPQIKFVVAGANPIAALTELKNPRVEVTGFVESVQGEIARSALYVAPLVSGGGFKNKIVEALGAGTFVVATKMATEFLDDKLRELMLIADDAEDMARHIIAYLERPQEFETRRQTLQNIVQEEFTWERRTAELIRIAADAGMKQPTCN